MIARTLLIVVRMLGVRFPCTVKKNSNAHMEIAVKRMQARFPLHFTKVTSVLLKRGYCPLSCRGLINL